MQVADFNVCAEKRAPAGDVSYGAGEAAKLHLQYTSVWGSSSADMLVF